MSNEIDSETAQMFLLAAQKIATDLDTLKGQVQGNKERLAALDQSLNKINRWIDTQNTVQIIEDTQTPSMYDEKLNVLAHKIDHLPSIKDIYNSIGIPLAIGFLLLLASISVTILNSFLHWWK